MMRSISPAPFSRGLTRERKSGSITDHSVAEPAAHGLRSAQNRVSPGRINQAVEYAPGPLLSLDAWVLRREAAARAQFSAVSARLKPDDITGWFARLLETQILPALKKIGFDPILARSLMSLAAPAWRRMGPPPASGIRIHPRLTRTIAEVRRGMRADDRRQSETEARLDAVRPSELKSLAVANAEPARLFTLFEEIAPSWLILPRAYRALTPQDSHCLPVYLSCLDGEPDSVFRMALIRVVIEFIGNFTLKFHRSAVPEEDTATALFFVYAALFWKTLRNPPAGCRSGLVCDCFYRWARRLNRMAPCGIVGVDKVVAQMKAARQRVIPQPDAFGRMPAAVGRYHPEAALMALRNGEPGTAAVVGVLGPSANLYQSATAARIPYTQVPAILQSLLRTIKGRWRLESSFTCSNIRRFLTRLADRYRIAAHSAPAVDARIEPSLQFTAPRVHRMIHSFKVSLT